MRSQLEEQIETKRVRCSAQLNAYRTQTEAMTTDYHTFLERDAKSSKDVEQRLRQVERMQTNIAHWKGKTAANKQEAEERNAQLKMEKEGLHRHFRELKGRMGTFRTGQRKRLVDLTCNARTCQKGLENQVAVAERILIVAEACHKLETQREKVNPYYLNREVDLDALPMQDEALREEMRDALADTGVDEWTYLDLFLKRHNKAYLDLAAIDSERAYLENENTQLRFMLKQVLDGVSVSQEVLASANPLLVVNGRTNLNRMPVMRTEPRAVIEAAHLVASHEKATRA